MKYKIEITNNKEYLIEEIYFNTLQELQRFYYSINRKKDLQIKYRSYILRSYIYYETQEGPFQEELREYFKIFPDNPTQYTYTRSVLSNLKLGESEKVRKERIIDPFKVVTTVIIVILCFPILIILGAIKSMK